MKQIGYLLYAWIYNLCRFIFPEKKGKIVLWNGHNHGINGNIREICDAYKEMDDVHVYIMIKRDLFRDTMTGRRKNIGGLLADICRFFVIFPYQMATAEKIFFNDNFLPLCYMHTGKTSTQFVQLWHGAGVFKRFGLSTETDHKTYEKVRKANSKITHLFVTSQGVKPFYREAFAVPEDRIYVTGLPVTDIYFDENRKNDKIKSFYDKYSELKEKKILLYAPTFRNTEKENSDILKYFQIEKVHEVLGDDWVILVKFHPKFPGEDLVQNKYCYNMTQYNDITDLYLVSDMLVTDYSSSVVEYVLLEKPIVLFAYDLEEYDRGFYFDYRSVMPGEIAYTEEELLKIISKRWNNIPKRQDFVKFEYDNIDGNACKRILEILG